jgi:hypothetical protein
MNEIRKTSQEKRLQVFNSLQVRSCLCMMYIKKITIFFIKRKRKRSLNTLKEVSGVLYKACCEVSVEDSPQRGQLQSGLKSRFQGLKSICFLQASAAMSRCPSGDFLNSFHAWRWKLTNSWRIPFLSIDFLFERSHALMSSWWKDSNA